MLTRSASPGRTFSFHRRLARCAFAACAIAWCVVAAAQDPPLDESQLDVTRSSDGGVLIFERTGDRAETDALSRIEAFCGGRSYRILARDNIAYGTRVDEETGTTQLVTRFRLQYACAPPEHEDSPTP